MQQTLSADSKLSDVPPVNVRGDSGILQHHVQTHNTERFAPSRYRSTVTSHCGVAMARVASSKNSIAVMQIHLLDQKLEIAAFLDRLK